MRNVDTISVDTARELVDFSGSSLSLSLAEYQLHGAVAIHNILAREGFAYLADEVGMGKTYVALGVVGLLRFFNPGIRVLYIAPRENIQSKWIKELKNFTRNNWLKADQRVKSVQGTPCVETARCENLADWARQAVRNPNRDFFLRMTSFSLPLCSDGQKWRSKRDEVAMLAPMIDSSLLDLRNKERFKASYAQVINTLLPHYDLVIIDEAHNFKRGMKSQAARDKLLSLLLGRAMEGEAVALPNYGRRFDRVLMLSATPLETDYAEIWHQLNLFGMGEKVKKLIAAEVDDAEKREIVSRFMIRRLTGLVIGGKTHTKNMYRREWRGGGCVLHDEPLEIPDQRQRLIVALVQKKVAELLNSPRFNASFQIGMLASFESFLETAKVKSDDDEDAVFDQSEQAEDDLEKEGIDRPAVNRLAESYWRNFGEPLPHPKMDAIVRSLKETFDTGAKTLVFVRRVKSVTELKEKLCREYDAWLKKQLLLKLPKALGRDIESIWSQYEAERREAARARGSALRSALDYEPPDGDELSFEQDEQADEDEGGIDTFFAWFFRGKGPQRLLSGAAFRKNRLQGMGSAYSTFFEDNYVAALIGVTEGAFEALASELERLPEELRPRLRKIAYGIYRGSQKKFPRLIVFHAYQTAALDLIAHSQSGLAHGAKVILRERYPLYVHQAMLQVPDGFPEPEEFINAQTFFTELRLRPSLREDIWPRPRSASLHECFLDQERRRELLAAVARLGHAFIDLWSLFVTRIGSLSMRAQERTDVRAEALIADYLNLLEQQRGERGFNAYQELAEVGRNYDLICSVNFPEIVQMPLAELARSFGRALSRQSPVGGMSGGINATLVKQFRMPGYPLALITTDVLQEGEDLHTFCSRIVHYGISWTPSAMEQRTGRVDRIGSQTHRRLDNRQMQAHPDELLQVYYPYLADTVEVLQVERVFERMNRFINLVHTFGKEEADSKLDTRVEFVRARQNIAQITKQLQSAFPVQKPQLEGLRRPTAGPHLHVEQSLKHLRLIAESIEREIRVEWEIYNDAAALYGTVFTDSGRLLCAGDLREPGTGDVRRQPFALLLRPSGMGGPLLLHGVSPVGKISMEDERVVEIVALSAELPGAKLCEVPSGELATYTLSVEGDIIFDPILTQAEEAADLLSRIAIAADWAERSLLEGLDQPFAKFRKDLREEAHRATD
jgi:superfamily II DNA or RNA helicase